MTAAVAYQQLSNAGCQERNNINKSRVLCLVTNTEQYHVKISLQPVTMQSSASTVISPLPLMIYKQVCN